MRLAQRNADDAENCASDVVTPGACVVDAAIARSEADELVASG